MSFWCGVLAAILFMCVAHDIVKDKRWDKWTVDDFKIAQEAELKNFFFINLSKQKLKKMQKMS